MKSVLVLSSLFLVVGCSSSPKSEVRPGRVVIDNSFHGETLPSWTKSSEVSFDEGDKVAFKSMYTVLGSDRVNGCYDLARLEMNEKILSEIENDIRAELNLASEGISEGSNTLMTKSLQSKLTGKIRGLRHKEEVYERYVVAGTERVDCFVKSQMNKNDYQALKQNTLSALAANNSEVAKAVRERQTQFFKQAEEQQ